MWSISCVFKLGFLLRSSLVVVAVFSELVSACGVAGVTLLWSGRDGTFDFSGEESFAQCRQSHPDRSNLVSSDAGPLDFDGLEFGVSVAKSSSVSSPDRSNRVASSIVTRRCDRLFGSRECFLASLE